MKRVLLLAVVALFVMMPSSSFARTPISDSDLSAVTAQEGVSIYWNNVTTSAFSFTASWGQSNISSVTGQPIANFAFDKGGFAGVDVMFGDTSINGLLTIDVGVNNSAFGTSSKGYSASTGTYIRGSVARGLDNVVSQEPTQLIIKFSSEETLTNTATTELVWQNWTSA